MKILLIIGILIAATVSAVAQSISPPKGVNGSLDVENRAIELSWHQINEKIAGYHLFVMLPGSEDYLLWGQAGLIYDTLYVYPLKLTTGGRYSFKIAGFQNFPNIIYGEKSVAVEIEVPPEFLPLIENLEVKTKKSSAFVSWEFEEGVFSHDGFAIWLNGEKVEIPKDARAYQFKQLDPGVYKVQVSATSRYGISSRYPLKKLFKIKE